MSAKKAFDDKALFEEKYALYGDMLYKLGIIYFGQGNDNQMCQEAISEAFLWLFTRKKSFKNSEKEKLELIRHMVLICESKSKRKPKRLSVEGKEMSEDTLYSESMDVLEATYELPGKYKSVVHLALYENLDICHISKALSITSPIVKKLLAKGMELMEIVLERKLDGEHYRSMLDEIEPSPEAKEKLYQYVVSHHSVKKYITPRQKRSALLSSIALASAVFVFMRFNPQVGYAIKTKYILLKGGIASVTIKNLVSYNGSGVFFTGDSDNTTSYQAYTIKNKRLAPLDTRHVSGSVEYLGESYTISFYCCEKSNSLSIKSDPSSPSTVFPIKNNTHKVLAYLNPCISDIFYNYPLIVDIDTMEVTDFLADCDFSHLDPLSVIVSSFYSDDLTQAVFMTNLGDLYFCDITLSSLNRISTYQSNSLCSALFNDDGTILYCIYCENYTSSSRFTSYYEYSISSGDIRECFQYTNNDASNVLWTGNHSAILYGSSSECSVIDISSLESVRVPVKQQEDLCSYYALESPDGSLIAFIYSKYANVTSPLTKIAKVCIYNRNTGKLIQLNPQKYEGIVFANAFWYDNDHITLYKQNETPSKTNSSSLEQKNSSTLWIFDINKLH